MGMSKNIKIAMIEKGIKLKDLAAASGDDPKVLSVKLSRDNMNMNSIIKLADALNCDVVLKDRETGKTF